MHTWLRRWGWPLGKAVLALAILFGVGRQFYRDLDTLDWTVPIVRPEWLGVSAILYLAALGFSAGFWQRLLRRFGQQPHIPSTIRAYYVGHLGKYVPGKAWALLLRGMLVRGPEVALGAAIVTAFYEVLTTMAAGVLLAAAVFVIQPPQVPGLEWNPVLTGLLLVGLCGIPLLPQVFNRLLRRLEARFPSEALSGRTVAGRALAAGILLTGCGWALMGAGLWAVLAAVLAEPPELTPATWAHVTASLGLAYVAGFLAVFMPGGLGVREYFLLHLLGTLGPENRIALAVLMARLLWTGAELATAAVVYWLPVQSRRLAR
jgi:uncharacterized membrane protein YbhN (UPF0104 family)